MKKERRWLKSVIAAARADASVLPWQRSVRRKPAMAKPAAPARGLAAR